VFAVPEMLAIRRQITSIHSNATLVLRQARNENKNDYSRYSPVPHTYCTAPGPRLVKISVPK